MATGRLPDPNTAPVTAKGDLYTYSTVPAKLAVGSNGETLVADSSATTGLRWQAQPITAGKNQIINGGFDIWQRGTSFTTNSGFTADRFTANSNTTFTASQQTFTPGSAPVAGYEAQYYLQFAQGAAGTFMDCRTRLEDVRTLAGQTVTLSAWMRVTSGTLSIEPYYLQVFGSGGSANVGSTVTAQTINTTWTRYSWTFTLPSISGKTIGTNNYLEIYLPRVVVSGGFTVQIWGLQLEAGNVATTFSRAGGTLAGELAACQRYFWAPSINDNVMGNAYSTSAAYFAIPYAVPMRVVPTPTYPGTLTSVVGDLVSAVNRTPTAVASYVMSGTDFASWTATGMTGLVAGYPVTFRSNITWSAEL